MNLHVAQERDGHAPAERMPFQSREREQRQPGKQRDDDRAAADQLQRVTGDVRPAQKLVERSAEDEREVLRVPAESFAEG